MKHPNRKIMLEVLKLAKEKKSVACFVLRGNTVVTRATTTVFDRDGLPTGHAEINAIEKTCRKLKRHDLEGCWLYSSLECCPMCAAACCWAELDGVVYSADGNDRKRGAKFDDWIFVKPEQIFQKRKNAPKLVKHFMRKDGKKALNWD